MENKIDTIAMDKKRAVVKRVINQLTTEQLKDLKINGKVYTYDINGKKYNLVDGKIVKICMGEDYNFIFDKILGNFARWGKTYEDDPEFSPVGGEILDIEVTTICHGIKGKLCPFCYKSNTPNGTNMSFDTFKKIIDRMPKTLTQIAFGADSQATSNPELWKMMDYCKEIGVVPNITVADVSDEVAENLKKRCGAVAISRYADKNVCYDSIDKLTRIGMNQINMHFMVSSETFDACMETLKDIKIDPRLAKLNAIVLLSLKKKGRGIGFTPLSQDKYTNLINFCLENNISFGMDSCGAKKFLDAVKDHPDYDKFKVVAEPCESLIFSQFCDVNGDLYPCSFCDKIQGWEKGINIANCDSYLKDVWYNDKVIEFRHKLTSNCNNCHKARECPVYEV